MALFIVDEGMYKLCFIDEHTTKRVRLTEAGSGASLLNPPSLESRINQRGSLIRLTTQLYGEIK